MSDLTMQRVRIVNTFPDRSISRIDTAGLVIPATPGLLITPYHRHGQPVPGRFTLTVTPTGHGVVPLAWCSHLAMHWAKSAGWIGVDWRGGTDVTGSTPARVFAWRLFDEFRAHCDRCPPLPLVDGPHQASTGKVKAGHVRVVGLV